MILKKLGNKGFKYPIGWKRPLGEGDIFPKWRGWWPK